MNEDPFGNFKKGNEFNDEKIINAKIIRKKNIINIYRHFNTSKNSKKKTYNRKWHSRRH